MFKCTTEPQWSCGEQPAHVRVAKAKKQSTAWFFTEFHWAELFWFAVAEHWPRAWQARGFTSTLCPGCPSPSGREKMKGNVLLCLLDSSLWESHCWVHPFSLLMAPRFVDNFIRCFTKDKNQHNKTLKYLVLIFLCGYSVNILMQNVSDQCLRTTRQCEIHVW